MARSSEKTGWLNHQLVIPVKWVVAAVIALPLLLLYVMAATDPDGNIALVGNEVVDDGAGGRIWRGRMMNTSGPPSPSQYREIAVTIRFLDKDGQPVGEARGSKEVLEARETFDFEAPLPPGAERMQVYSLQWRTGNGGALLGPWQPWEFGYLQYDPPES